MIIKVLAENNTVSDEFDTEHGLSLYIETGGKKIMFDTGETDVFVKNARRLGVDLADVDMAVVSHGHCDHGGGLKTFYKENAKAPVYLHPKAMGKYYSEHPEGREYIGLEAADIEDNRVVLTTEHDMIGKNIEIFSNVSGREFVSLSNRNLKMEKDGEIVGDIFEHEQNMIITEDGKTFLFEGCAHKGIVNIIRRYYDLKHAYPDYVFGGFHLQNPSTGISEDAELIRKIGETLKDTGATYYTGHCTGLTPYQQLKTVMGDWLEYLATGRVLEL